MNSQQAPDSETPSSAKASEPVKKSGIKAVIRKIGLDMIPVIAGILIALFISNLQQNFLDHRLLRSTLQSLSDEFSKNKENIERLLPRQQSFLDTLILFMEDTSYSISDMSEKTKGMGTPEIYSTNWRSSLNNNSLRLLNFSTISLLSQIDAKYQELKAQEEFIFSVAYGPPFFKKGEEGWEYRKGLESWMHSYIGNQHELLDLYKQFEQVVETKKYGVEED